MPAVDPSPSDVNNPSVFTQEQVAVNYLDGPTFINEYDLVEGVAILPVAESPPDNPSELQNWSPVVRIRLHSPYRIRTARFRALKQNGPPVLPGPGDQGAFIFTGGSVLFNNVYVKNGVFNWDCTATYQYVENCVSRTIDGFVLGVPAIPYPVTEGLLSVIGGVLGGAGIGGFAVPSPGAIAYAGDQAKIGWTSQNTLGPDLYNYPTFFPGVFFNDGLMNASLSSTSGTGPSGPVQPVP